MAIAPLLSPAFPIRRRSYQKPTGYSVIPSSGPGHVTERIGSAPGPFPIAQRFRAWWRQGRGEQRLAPGATAAGHLQNRSWFPPRAIVSCRRIGPRKTPAIPNAGRAVPAAGRETRQGFFCQLPPTKTNSPDAVIAMVFFPASASTCSRAMPLAAAIRSYSARR